PPAGSRPICSSSNHESLTESTHAAAVLAFSGALAPERVATPARDEFADAITDRDAEQQRQRDRKVNHAHGPGSLLPHPSKKSALWRARPSRCRRMRSALDASQPLYLS